MLLLRLRLQVFSNILIGGALRSQCCCVKPVLMQGKDGRLCRKGEKFVQVEDQNSRMALYP